mgnify:CR=1 FL=1
MPRLYDNKKKAWRNIPTLVWWVHRLLPSKRYSTSVIGTQGFDFTGANKVTVINTDVKEHLPGCSINKKPTPSGARYCCDCNMKRIIYPQEYK